MFPLLSTRTTRLKAGGGADSPSDKATRPGPTFILVIPHTPPALPRTHRLGFRPLSLCVGAEGRGQPVRPAGVLICGTVLISTGVQRRKQRYLPPPPPPSLFLLFRSPSLRLSRLLPSRCLRRQICEGCLCQLSFHGRLPAPLHILRLLSFPRLFPDFIFPSTFRCAWVNKLCLQPVSVVQPRLRAGGFFFNARSFCLWRTYGTLAQLQQGREQGRERLGGPSVRRTAPAL